MAFSFRYAGITADSRRENCYERLGGCEVATSSRSTLHEYRFWNDEAEGLVEFKFVTGNLFKREQWTNRYCSLRNGIMRIYGDEKKEEPEISSVDLNGITEFNMFYRLVREAKDPNGGSITLGCIFTFSDDFGGKVKIRVSTDDDADYWMMKFRRAFLKVSRPAPKNDQSLTDKSKSPFDKQFSCSTAPQFSSWPFNSNEKTPGGSCFERKTTPSNHNMSQVGQSEIRHQVAQEFIENLRRTDTMLEERQISLRSKLQEWHERGTSTISSTQGRVITDYEEEITKFYRSSMSRSSTFTSIADVKSEFVQPPGLNSKKQSCDDDSSTLVSTVTAIIPKPLPTIIDDRLGISRVNSCANGQSTAVSVWTAKDANELRSPVRYTSSMVIQLGGSCPSQSSNDHATPPCKQLSTFSTVPSSMHISNALVKAAPTTITQYSRLNCNMSRFNASTFEKTPVASSPASPPLPASFVTGYQEAPLPLPPLATVYPKSSGNSSTPPPPPSSCEGSLKSFKSMPSASPKHVMTPSFFLELKAAISKRQTNFG